MIVTPESYLSTKLEVLKTRQTKEFGDDFGVNLFANSTTSITVRKALAIETVYTCIRDKAETVGRLPVRLYEKEDDKVSRVDSGRLHRIFTQKPNDFMTMQGFEEFMVASYELYGAFYAYIAKNDTGSIMEIIPFRYQQNVVPAMDQNGNVYYMYTTNDGKPRMAFGIDQLFIINQFTLDGYTPTSPISQNAAFLNGTHDTESGWNELQAKGITAQFALSTDKTVNADAAVQLKKDWDDNRGPSGVSKTPILEDGMKITPLRLSPKDAELLSNREFSVNRICRIFRVPPERIGVPSSSGKQTFLDIDEFYMRNCIEPILLKYESAMNMLLANLKVKKFVRVNRKAFYAGSPHRMVEAVTAEFKMCACTINEMRIDLGRDPVKGGDVFAIDTNNLTLGLLTDIGTVQEQIANQNPKPEKPAVGGNDEA
jgi:HK97 family phage portal protein